MTKILIIDDDLSVGTLLKPAIWAEGWMLELARDGKEGLSKVKTYQPDLILLDVLMPEMNGFEVLDKLKADPTTKEIKVVMYTNLDDEKDAETALSKGALRYLIKIQYTTEELCAQLREILTKPSS